MARLASGRGPKRIEVLRHDGQARPNIPTAEMQSVADLMEEASPVPPARFPRRAPLPPGEERSRDRDRDPQLLWQGARITLTPEQVQRALETGEVEVGDAQLVWRGKDRQDWSDLVTAAPPLYIQEKVHPKAILDSLAQRGGGGKAPRDDAPDLFADFNGLPDPEARTEFYAHDQHWSNRMVLGDSLHVMASLAEREGLRGKVQCIYFDPPYGIKFNTNWQVSTNSSQFKDGRQADLSRDPEQIKAFRDTWKDGIHSYLSYLRDRVTLARELLAVSGAVFLQIGDENVHRIRALMDEVFGDKNLVAQIVLPKITGVNAEHLATNNDHILFYARSIEHFKFRRPLSSKGDDSGAAERYDQAVFLDGTRLALASAEVSKRHSMPYQRAQLDNLTSSEFRPDTTVAFAFQGASYHPGQTSHWKTTTVGLRRLGQATRLASTAGKSLRYIRLLSDSLTSPLANTWFDISGSVQSRSDPKVYVVQTSTAAVQRCILMATDPGDLVLDPTCGSGTTATVAEQWGRRWITIDTSRVALALARARIMGARYPAYLLADSPEGRRKEGEITGKPPLDAPTTRDLRQGFVYDRAPHVTLKSIANNAEIDAIWDTWQARLEPLRTELNGLLSRSWEEWQLPREADPAWPEGARRAHAAWWEARVARQQEIDRSIAKAADVELLYDRPYEDKTKVRVAGPFTVESLQPHRAVSSAEEELIDAVDAAEGRRARTARGAPPTDFAAMVLDHLRTAGVHQAERWDTIRFTTLQPWPGTLVGAEGRFMEGETERRAAILVGPEFGTLTRPDLVAAAREAAEARFDVLVACAFSYDAHASELSKLGPLRILKARMNPDLHMADDLKNTGKGNLFAVFGEPDIEIAPQADGQLVVEIRGLDVFDPNTGDIRSSDTSGIAAWFIDTDYDEESFFVRHAYFLGAQDPYRSLKTALRAEIDEEASSTLYRATSRPFPRPTTGRIAVKVINHFGDEVMKVFPA